MRLLETQACDIAISDDGLQHYAMARDLEIAVIDGTRGLGNGLLLPAGPLREPAARLQEVDWVIANGEPSGVMKDESVMRMHADGFFNLATTERLDCEEFVRRYPQIHAVCGIGNPARFFNSLHELGLSTVKHTYSDHYNFAGPEVRFGDALQVVCTEKDAAKLNHLEDDFSHVWFLRVSVELPEEAHQRLCELLHERGIVPNRELVDSGGLA